MLMIRLQRVGRKNDPKFRFVLTDSRNSTKSGRFLEILGSFDPRHDEMKVIDADRVKHWISNGAQLSHTVHNFLLKQKIITGKKRNVLSKRFPIKKVEEPAKAATNAGATVEAPQSSSTEVKPENSGNITPSA